MSSEDILEHIYTRFDQHRYLFELDGLLQALYRPENKSGVDLNQIKDKNLAEILKTQEWGQMSRVETRKMLEEMVDAVVHMEVVELRSATSLSDVTQEKLALWMKAQLGKNIFVEFVAEPELIGGTVLTFRGKYIDLSLKTKMFKFFSNNTQWIRNYFEL